MLKKLRIWTVFILIIVVIATATYIGVQKYISTRLSAFYQDKATLSSEALKTTLEAASELVTSKVTFRGLAEYSDEGIPVINKGDFVMVYKATVKAGIDTKKIGVAVDNNKHIVYLYLPDAEILEVKVDPGSITYYNESFAFFNNNQKEDANRAQMMAEEDAVNDAMETGILDLANQQSETLVRGILEEAVKDYEFKFLDTSEELANKKK